MYFTTAPVIFPVSFLLFGYQKCIDLQDRKDTKMYPA